ncbi:hypothetical protein OHQ88_10545 [Micromonospora zamorensis]|uniref:hypothetical protein n=1 Tax=Micromonospora zamorensis TaxID=709883 RepID=UPI002E230435
MRSLGTFGAALREADPYAEKDSFDFCGEQFEVQGRIPPMLMLQLGAAASGKIEEMEGMAAIWEAMRCSLTAPERKQMEPDPETGGQTMVERTVDADAAEFQRFYKLAVASYVGLEELIRLAMALFEAQAGRPTGQQPALQAGPLPTSTSSNGSASVHPALQGMSPVDRVLAG